MASAPIMALKPRAVLLDGGAILFLGEQLLDFSGVSPGSVTT